MQYEASDRDWQYQGSVSKNDLRLVKQLFEANYSAEQEEAGNRNQGDHHKFVSISKWEARAEDTCCHNESSTLRYKQSRPRFLLGNSLCVFHI